MTHNNRGKNPNSQKNLVSGRNKKVGGKKTEMILTEKAREGLRTLGEGNMSEGAEKLGRMIEAEINIDRFFSRMPIAAKVKLALTSLIETPNLIDCEIFQHSVQDLIDEIDSLGLEEDFKNAEIELGRSQGDVWIV